VADFEVSIIKTLSIRDKEWQSLKCVKWSVMYMGVRLVKWSVMYMGVRVVKLSVMYMGVRLVKWSVMPFLTSNRKCFTYWHFKICHSLPLIESVLLIAIYMTDHFTSLTPIYMTNHFTSLTPIYMTDHLTGLIQKYHTCIWVLGL
jgi:hypothetical protein